jgi:hypothetical protein
MLGVHGFNRDLLNEQIATVDRELSSAAGRRLGAGGRCRGADHSDRFARYIRTPPNWPIRPAAERVEWESPGGRRYDTVAMSF